jgi:proline iminopeptidase
VSEIVLSAILTTRLREIDWLYGGASRFFPEEHERFVADAGSADPAAHHVVAEYDRPLGHPDRDVRAWAAAAWGRWEEAVLSLEPNAKPTSFGGPVDDDLLALTRVSQLSLAKRANSPGQQ